MPRIVGLVACAGMALLSAPALAVPLTPDAFADAAITESFEADWRVSTKMYDTLASPIFISHDVEQRASFSNQDSNQALSPAALAEKAAASIRGGFPWEAISLLETCIAKNPNDRKCNSLLAEARAAYERMMVKALEWRNPNALRLRERDLAELDRTVPGEYAAELAKIRFQIADLEGRSAQAVRDLHAGRPTAAAELLRAYQGVDVLAGLRSEWQNHERAQVYASREYRSARQIETIAAPDVDDQEAVLARRMIRTTVPTVTEQDLQAAIARGDLAALDSIVAASSTNAAAINETSIDTLRARVRSVLDDRLDQTIAANQFPRSASTRRYVTESILGRWSALAALARAGAKNGESALQVTGSTGACGNTDNQALVVESARTALDDLAFPAGEMRAEVVTWECSTGVPIEVESVPIPSSYVQSHQQFANPEHVQLMQEIDEARRALARLEAEPGGGGPLGGALQGVREGMAREKVNALMRKLAGTPPFRSTPVLAPYVTQRVTFQRITRIRVGLRVTDVRTLQSETEELQAEKEEVAQSVRGAMPGDSALKNREARFASSDQILHEAFQKVGAEVGDSIRRLAGAMWLARARSIVSARGPSTDVLGSLLYARDALGGDAPELFQTQSLLNSALALTPSALRTAKLDFSTVAAAERPMAERSAGANRNAMVDRVLGSVVTVETEQASGSGFFVDGNGLILTNAHVVEGSSRIRIRTRSDDIFLARVVQTVQDKDLALLRISTSGVPALPLGTSDAGVVGIDVFAVGSPLGLQGTVTKGIVSAIRRMNGLTLLQIDAPINAGNSGGPLVDENGVVLGINTSKLTGGSAEGLGFAVAVDEVRRAFGRLLPPPAR